MAERDPDGEVTAGEPAAHRTPAGRRFVVTRGSPDEEELVALALTVDRLANLARGRRPGSPWVLSDRPGLGHASWADASPWPSRSAAGWRSGA